MTKTDFILQAALQLAGTGQYKDKYDSYEGLMRKEKLILDDAVRLANFIEENIWIGEVSSAVSVFEREEINDKRKL